MSRRRDLATGAVLNALVSLMNGQYHVQWPPPWLHGDLHDGGVREDPEDRAGIATNGAPPMS